MPTLRFGLCYDFRNPPDSGIAMPDLYAEVLDQVGMAEQLGFDQVWFTEHHFVDDGYLPSWIPVAAAAAARTAHIRFSTDICLLPFNHPVRLAEDLAVLDNLSNGRVELGVGMGYAPHEFRGFGLPVRRRVSLMDEGIEVLQRCFSGERFSYRGRRYQCEDVKIAPGYVQPGGPPLWIAAMSKGGAERAARFGTHLLPQGVRADTLDHWQSTHRAKGCTTGKFRIGIIRGILVTDDVEKEWSQVRVAERYRMELYNRFFAESGEGLGNTGERVPQTWIVGNADHCVKELVNFIRDCQMTDIVSWGAPPGLRPAAMNSSIEKLAKEVIPRVRAALVN